MVNLQSKKRADYAPDDLERLDFANREYWDSARSLETESVNDFEKHLWLANGAALTISIGFIQSKESVSVWQYSGSWLFLTGIVLLVLLKYLSAFNSSRERFRFQDAASRFEANEVTDEVFRDVRDKTFNALKRCYLWLQWGAGVAFILGVVATLLGVGCSV